jgi:hypothetical protein
LILAQHPAKGNGKCGIRLHAYGRLTKLATERRNCILKGGIEGAYPLVVTHATAGLGHARRHFTTLEAAPWASRKPVLFPVVAILPNTIQCQTIAIERGRITDPSIPSVIMPCHTDRQMLHGGVSLLSYFS